MFIDNDTDEGSGEEQNPNTENDSSGADFKTELEAVKLQNQELLTKMNSFLTQQQKPETKKQITSEEFAKLLKDDPKSAIQIALDEKVQGRVNEIESRLTTAQQTVFFDQKVEQDFPALKTDKKFRDLVAQETRNLVQDGLMNEKAPKLLYKAAEIAALKYNKAGEGKAEAKNSMSSEAPNNGARRQSDGSKDKHLPANFERMASMFNLDDKTKDRAKEIIADRQRADEHRRSRRY